MMSYSPVDIHRRLEGTYCLLLQEKRLNQESNQQTETLSVAPPKSL
jgi:hypothetical protein